MAAKRSIIWILLTAPLMLVFLRFPYLVFTRQNLTFANLLPSFDLNSRGVIREGFTGNGLSNYLPPAQSPQPDIRTPNYHYRRGVITRTPYKKWRDKDIKIMLRTSKVEKDLAEARAAIVEAIRTQNITSYGTEGFKPRGAVYRNSVAFHQSHIEMVKRFRVWTYKEGEQPLFHDGPLNSIYGVEGQFIDEIQNNNSSFSTRDPYSAHVFFVPVSVANIVHYLYRPLVTYGREIIHNVFEDYISLLTDRYPHWNRSQGADHFFVSCHDWGPDVSTGRPEIFKNFIRVLCNANTSEGFQPRRDASIPEINIPRGQLGPPITHLASSNRSILAFFAGGSHGHIRKILLEHWKEKDEEIQVHEYLKNSADYFKLMGKSKFCLCPSGYEVASPRIVAAIQLGCVPVIISANYWLPFSDVLDWNKFTVFIPPEKIPHIKSTLKNISERRYMVLRKRVASVRIHFTVNRPAQPFDVFHMVLHSIWLRRLNFSLQDS